MSVLFIVLPVPDLPQTFVDWAGHYHMQMERGKHHNAAVRALAYKWGESCTDAGKKTPVMMKQNTSLCYQKKVTNNLLLSDYVRWKNAGY